MYEQPEETFRRTLLIDDLYTGQNAATGTTGMLNPIASHHAALHSLTICRIPHCANRKREEEGTYEMQMIPAHLGHRFASTEKTIRRAWPQLPRGGSGVCFPWRKRTICAPARVRPKCSSGRRRLCPWDHAGRSFGFGDSIPAEIQLCWGRGGV
jgi:hypothetical protein